MSDKAPELKPEHFKEMAEKCLQLNVETRFYEPGKSIFARQRTAMELAEKLHSNAYQIVSNTLWIDPIFYLHCTRDGKEEVLGVNMTKFIHRHPVLASCIVANMMAITEAHSYAVVMNAWLARREMKKIRAHETIFDKLDHESEGLVVYVEHNAKTGDDDDNDKAYLVHPYGRMDDLLFWDPDKIVCEPPLHSVPGRFWRMFSITPMVEQFNKLTAHAMISDGREMPDDDEGKETEKEEKPDEGKTEEEACQDSDTD